MGKCFNINGKTTILTQLEKKLSGAYHILNISFESVGDEYFSDERNFVRGFETYKCYD